MQHGHPRMRCTKCGRCGGSRACWPVWQALQTTCSKGLEQGRNAVRRAATAAAAILLGRGIKEAGSSLQCLAENPSVQLPLLLPVELQKVSRSARVVVRGCFRQWKQQAQAQGARRRQGRRRVRRHARYRHVRADIQARRWRPTLTSRLDASLMGASSSTRAAVRHVVDTKIRDLPMRKRRLINGHARKWVRANALRAAMVARNNAAVVKLRGAVAALHCANRASEGKRQYGQRIRNGTGHITCRPYNPKKLKHRAIPSSGWDAAIFDVPLIVEAWNTPQK